MQSLVRSISQTIDQCLNGTQAADGQRQWGYVLIVAPANVDPPLKAEVLFNVTADSARAVLLEGVARLEGRVVDHEGKA